MTTIALQKRLIQKIAEIQDIDMLKHIDFFIKEQSGQATLTPLQKKLISKSEEEYKTGNVTEHSVLMEEIAQKYGW